MNHVSIDPSVLRRAIYFDPIQLYVVKLPPTTILPSLWIFIDLTVELNQLPILKPVSIDPSEFRRIRYFTPVQLYTNMLQPTIIFPSL